MVYKLPNLVYLKNLSTVNCFQTTSIEPNSQDIKTMHVKQ